MSYSALTHNNEGFASIHICAEMMIPLHGPRGSADEIYLFRKPCSFFSHWILIPCFSLGEEDRADDV